MPTYSFNPMSGEQSELTAFDQLRQRNADRMTQMSLAEAARQAQAAQSAAALAAQERMFNANRQDQGTIFNRQMAADQAAQLAKERMFNADISFRGNEGQANREQALALADRGNIPELERIKLMRDQMAEASADKKNSVDYIIGQQLASRLRDQANPVNQTTLNMTSMPQWQGQGPAMRQVQAGQGGSTGDDLFTQIIKAKYGIQPSRISQVQEELAIDKMRRDADPRLALEQKRKDYSEAQSLIGNDIQNVIGNFGGQNYLSNDDVIAFKQHRDMIVNKLKTNGFDNDTISQIMDDIRSQIETRLQNNWFNVGPQGSQISALFKLDTGNEVKTQPVTQTRKPLTGNFLSDLGAGAYNMMQDLGSVGPRR